LKRFYAWEPDITQEQCVAMGLGQSMTWKLHGQTVTIYLRKAGNGK
jgi:hypothetical protein